MCYSTTSSLVVGAGLCLTGVATMRLTRRPQELPVAAIPLLFGLQQLAEGAIWASLGPVGDTTDSVMVSVYLFFALVLWPTWVPFAAWMIEPSRVRRRVISVFGAFGLVVSGYLAIALVGHDLAARAEAHRLVYDLPGFPADPNVLPYVAVTCIPLLLSSLRSLRVFGVVAIITSAVAHELYSEAFISAWCFMAAIASAVLLAHFVNDRLPRGIATWKTMPQ